MSIHRLIVICALAFVTACHASDEERRSVIQSAGRVNYEVALGAVVRDSRSPVDSGRVIYDAPTHLSQPSASDAGARQVWAPFGIANPDTIAPTSTR